MADAPANPVFQVLGQLKDLWGRQPRSRKTLAVTLALGLAAVLAVTQLSHTTTDWQLVTDASPDDTQELYAALSARNLPVRLHAGKVEVESSRLGEARAIAAAAGLPRSGKGFELFDTSKLGQSSFAEQVNFRRALQGELSRSIASLAQVQNARVHLALGKRSVFKDQDEAASASVALHLHAGQALAADQVRGVRQLVAASIEGLKPEAVIVVDQHGNLLDGAAPGSVDTRAELERTLTARVRTMLERVVGAGKVSVVTTAVVDDREMTETQELYDQTNPVLRSEARTVEGDPATAGVGGIAGTRGNLPGAGAAGPTPGGGSSARMQETKNYEVNRTVRQTVKPEIVVTRLHLAIVVDHKTVDSKPVPRTAAELGELTALARQAAGIDDTRGDKIEMRSIAFAPDLEVEPTVTPAVTALPLVPIAIGGGAAVLVLVVLAAVVMKKRARRASRTISLALPAPIADLERALDARASEPVGLSAGPETRGLPAGRGVRDRVLDSVRADSERAAEVLTAWLSEPPQRGARS